MNVQVQDPRNIRLSGSTRNLLAQVSEIAEEVNGHRPFKPEIGRRIRETLLPDRIVASLNMEGIVATRRQTLSVMDAMRVSESVGRAEVEIFNALKADEFVQDAVENGLPLREDLIREINKLLLSEVRSDNGQLRSGPIELPGAPFLPPEAAELPALLHQLVESFKLSEALHPVTQAAWLHAQFTLIHPFSDGNGRTGRLLQDFSLLRRGMLPVGIPPSQRDDYYSSLASADTGDWDSIVEMLALLELSIAGKTLAIAREPEKRAAWISQLSKSAAKKAENTLHKQYTVWRQRMELVGQSFHQAARELDSASDVIGAVQRNHGVVDFGEWREICRRGYCPNNWLFSILFFADGKPFYKMLALMQRHRPRPRADPFAEARDLVALYFTGADTSSDEKPDYYDFRDPYIRAREVHYFQEELHYYRALSGSDGWECTTDVDLPGIVEEMFRDVFERKAGLGA